MTDMKKQAIEARIVKLLDRDSIEPKFFKHNRNVHTLLCDFYWKDKGGKLSYNSMHELKQNSMNSLLKEFLPNITKQELINIYTNLVK